MAGLNKLNAMQIKKAKPGDKLQDGGGLIFRKTETSGKWVFRYSISKRRREMGLGSITDLSLADARKARARWAACLLEGKDPISERQKALDAAEAEANIDEPTFEAMFDRAYEARKEGLRHDNGKNRWKSPIRVHLLPKIGSKRMTQIHQRDLLDALSPIWHSKHETADKALYRTKMVFKDAKLMGLPVDPDICDAARHLLGAVDHEEVHIEATPWQEIPRLYERLCEPHPSYRALRFAILTAARGTPVRGAKFEQITGDVWTIPKQRMKGKKGKVADFRIPLSCQALELVEECRSDARNQFLFPSPRADKGVSDVAMTKVLNTLKEPGRTHGFRSSFRTWVQDTDAAGYEVTETALGHVIGNKVERSYARSDLLDRRRFLMQKWADFVTGEEAKVVPLRGYGS